MEDVATTSVVTLTSDPVAAVQTVAQRGGKTLPVQGLTDEEIAQLIFIREEEKLARDVYLALAEEWNVPAFTNIAQSEQQHMDAVGQLIEKYGLEDPITNDEPGVFTNETLQDLYKELVARGEEPLLDAYKVGAFIEEYDIIGIERAIYQTSHNDIENVYENLVRGSRNHLRSFVGQIEATGEEYQPVLISGIDEVTGEDLDALASTKNPPNRTNSHEGTCFMAAHSQGGGPVRHLGT